VPRSLARVSSQLCALNTPPQPIKIPICQLSQAAEFEKHEKYPRVGYKFVFVSLLSVPDIV